MRLFHELKSDLSLSQPDACLGGAGTGKEKVLKRKKKNTPLNKKVEKK